MTHEPTKKAISGLAMGRFSALIKAETDQFHRNRPKSAALLERARKVMPDGVPMAWMVGLYDHLPPFFTDGQGARLVIPPFLTGCIRRTYAAIFSFCAGVSPPMPMFGRSLL